MTPLEARWREVSSLARLEAGAALVSPRLWLLRHWIPATALCFVAAVTVRDHGVDLDYGRIQGAAVRLAELLAAAYLGLAALGAPILVYSSFEEARRRGMLDALRATPLPAGWILIAMLAGKVRVGLHFVLAALPALALAWQAGGSEVIENICLPIAGFGLMSMSFAALLFATGKTPSGFAGWLLVYTIFQPAVLPLRVWISAVGLYLAIHGLLPDAWILHGLDDFVVSAAYPLSGLSRMVEGRLPSAAYAGAVVGWTLWTGLFLRSATKAFGVERRTAPVAERTPLQSRAWRLPKHPPGSVEQGRRAFSLSRRQIEEQGIVARRLYRLTGRNPFIYLNILRERRQSKSWDRSASHWKLVGSTVALVLLYLAFFETTVHKRAIGIDLMLVVGAFGACHYAAEVLGAHAAEAEVLLSSGVRERDVLVGAVGLAFLKVHPLLWCLGVVHLLEGPAEAAAMLVAGAGTILLASALGAWTMASTLRGMGNTITAYAAFAAIYHWLRSLLGAERGPWHEAMLGALLGAVGLWLLLALRIGFRRVVRSRA